MCKAAMGDIEQQARKAGLFDGSLSSCQAELQELMKQIDIMVNNRRLEWESSLRSVETELRQRKEEIVTVKMALDAKTAESTRLSHELTGMERSQKELVTQYEQQVDQLRRELMSLQKSYEKLQRHHSKQSDGAEKVKGDFDAKLREARVDLRMAQSKIEDYETQVREWDVQRRAYKKQVEGLEMQRQKLAGKCQALQLEVTSHSHQLDSQQQLLDQRDLDFRARIVHIEGQLQRAQDTLDGKNSSIQRLEELVEEGRQRKAEAENDNRQLLENLGRKEHQCRTLETEVSSLQEELQAKGSALNLTREELKKQMDKLENAVSTKEAILRDQEDESRMRSVQASEETSRLRSQLQDSQLKIQDLVESEARLKMEITRLENRLDAVQGDNAALNIELTERIEELRRLDKEARQGRASEKQKNQQEGFENQLGAELSGMRRQIETLTGALTQRNAMVNALALQLGTAEQQAQVEQGEREKLRSELQIANAELEALRVENRSLRNARPHPVNPTGFERETVEGQCIRHRPLGQGQGLVSSDGQSQEVDMEVLQSQMAAIQRQLNQGPPPEATITPEPRVSQSPGRQVHLPLRQAGARPSPRVSPSASPTARTRPGLVDRAIDGPATGSPVIGGFSTRTDFGTRLGTEPDGTISGDAIHDQVYASSGYHSNTLQGRTENLQGHVQHKGTPDSEGVHSLETGSLDSDSPLPSPPGMDSILGEDAVAMDDRELSAVNITGLSDLDLTSSDPRIHRPPSRESVGTRFIKEDQQHQVELERILNAHIKDLELKTTHTLAKHSERAGQASRVT